MLIFFVFNTADIYHCSHICWVMLLSRLEHFESIFYSVLMLVN